MNKQFWNTLKNDYYDVWYTSLKCEYKELNEQQLNELTLIRIHDLLDEKYGWECFNWEFKWEYYNKPKWACEKYEWKIETLQKFINSILKEKLNLKTKKQIEKWYDETIKNYELYF